MTDAIQNISLDEIKKIELEILKKIIKICDENNLRYSLMDGSLIGVIRHKGFIPWDDDIDIMMPRNDYEKLKSIMLNHPNDEIKYLSSQTQNDYYYAYAKVVSTKTDIKEYNLPKIENYGIFVDIFPIDAVHNNALIRYFQMFSMRFLRPFLEISRCEKPESNNENKLRFKKIIFLFAQKIGWHKVLNFINKISTKCNWDESQFATILYSTISTKAHKYYKKEIFEQTIFKQFEGTDVKVIKDYDNYLKDLFGDYMQLPSKDKQKSNHNFDYILLKD